MQNFSIYTEKEYLVSRVLFVSISTIFIPVEYGWGFLFEKMADLIILEHSMIKQSVFN